MNVIFLDFDGVVNTPMWEKTECGWKCQYGQPEGGRVNNEQAVQWVSDFCEKCGYKIVISSTWRQTLSLEECRICLVNAGLRDGIEVYSATPVLHGERGSEISQWLQRHSEVTGYLIFDDDSDMTVHMDRLVKCNCYTGFLGNQYNMAVTLHYAFNNRKE